MRRADSHWVFLCSFLLMAVALGSSRARAADEPLQRVAVLPKVTLGGAAQPEAQLETALGQALRQRGMRVVDLKVASEAQRLMWSDKVRAGVVPEGVNLMLADALYSAQLDCFQTARGIQGTSLVAVQCTLDSKLVRVDSGDVVFAEAVSLPGHGLNARAALDAISRARLPAVAKELAARVESTLAMQGDWAIDLVVSELADREFARGLVPGLRGLPGVTAARMVFFRAGLVKYVLAGRGERDLLAFSTALEADAQLSLSLVYETPRVLHARFDLARALPRPVVVLGLVADAKSAQQRELSILKAGLALVPYLEPAHLTPILSELGSGRSALALAQRKAAELGVPLILQLSLASREQRWFASAALVDGASGAELLTYASSGPDPEPALSEALSKLDAAYHGALGSPVLQRKLGIARHVVVAPSDGIVVDAFRLIRDGDRDLAKVVLRNVGPEQASHLTARIRSQRHLLAQLDWGDVSVGATSEREVTLPGSRSSSASPLSVEVDYQLAGQHRRAESFVLEPSSAEGAPVVTDAGVPDAYRELIKAAVRHYNRGDWQEARRLFLSVHAVAPNARVARGLGLVEFDLRNFESARKYFQEALASQVRPLEPEQRRQAGELLQRISELEARQPRAAEISKLGGGAAAETTQGKAH